MVIGICISKRYFEGMGAEIAGRMRLIMQRVADVRMDMGNSDARIVMVVTFCVLDASSDFTHSILCIV